MKIWSEPLWFKASSDIRVCICFIYVLSNVCVRIRRDEADLKRKNRDYVLQMCSFLDFRPKLPETEKVSER